MSKKRILCETCHIAVKIRILIGCHGRSTTGCSSSTQILHLLRILLTEKRLAANSERIKLHSRQWNVKLTDCSDESSTCPVSWDWCTFGVLCSRRAPQLLFLLLLLSNAQRRHAHAQCRRSCSDTRLISGWGASSRQAQDTHTHRDSHKHHY